MISPHEDRWSRADPATLTPMNADQIRERVHGLATFKRDGKRAPHKPLLLLIALARIQSREPQFAPYAEIKDSLEPLLARFWSRKNAHARFPFAYLRSDGLWEIPEQPTLDAAIADRSRQKDYPDRVLLDLGATGGFPAEVDETLRRDGALVHELTQILLEEHFPPSLHDDILDSIGMPWVSESLGAPAKRRTRDPRFRERVLRAYERRCAICGYDGRLDGVEMGLEAAHIRWHAFDGPDETANGLLLCSFHHKAFDLGAIGLTTERVVMISQDVAGNDRTRSLLHDFEEKRIHEPRQPSDFPAPEHLEWHSEQVFRRS